MRSVSVTFSVPRRKTKRYTRRQLHRAATARDRERRAGEKKQAAFEKWARRADDFYAAVMKGCAP